LVHHHTFVSYLQEQRMLQNVGVLRNGGQDEERSSARYLAEMDSEKSISATIDIRLCFCQCSYFHSLAQLRSSHPGPTCGALQQFKIRSEEAASQFDAAFNLATELQLHHGARP
jgi:hypothetical protein